MTSKKKCIENLAKAMNTLYSLEGDNFAVYIHINKDVNVSDIYNLKNGKKKD